jgi:diadenosine tetraphosphate (Ap4A) HIT family hydrolase
MESFARDRGLVLEQLDLDAWEALWQEAKIAEKAVKTAAKTA